MQSRYKLCTFDVTNTLLKFKVPVGEQYAKVGKMYGIVRDPAQLSSAFLSQWKINNSKYPNYGCSAGMTSREWWNRIVTNTFSPKGNEISSKQLDCISKHLYEIYESNVCWEVVPGVLSLLKFLKEKNILIGVISNFDERLQSILRANDLDSYFDFILASYLIKVAKPDKKIFDTALSKCPGILSTNALHVGDDILLDYHAAKKAGWNAILVSDKMKKEVLSGDIDKNEVVEDISKLKSLFF